MSIRARLCGLAIALLAAAGCEFAAGPTAGATPSPTEAVPTRCFHVTESVDYGPYVIAGLTEEGTLHGFPVQSGAPDAAVGATIVVARVVGLEPGIFDTTTAGPLIFTPVKLQVEQVLQGEVEPGELRVFIEGGTAGCSTVSVDMAPRLDAGERYVFFLYPGRTTGGAIQPDRLELKRDAWPLSGGDVVSTFNGPMSLAALIAAIERVVSGTGP